MPARVSETRRDPRQFKGLLGGPGWKGFDLYPPPPSFLPPWDKNKEVDIPV